MSQRASSGTSTSLQECACRESALKDLDLRLAKHFPRWHAPIAQQRHMGMAPFAHKPGAPASLTARDPQSCRLSWKRTHYNSQIPLLRSGRSRGTHLPGNKRKDCSWTQRPHGQQGMGFSTPGLSSDPDGSRDLPSQSPSCGKPQEKGKSG